MNKSEVILKLSTPGKVILFGEHAVVYGKTALAASLDLRTTIKIHKDNENNSDIHLNFKNLNTNEKLDLEKIKKHFFNENIPLIKNRSDFNVEYPEMIKHDEYIEMLKEFFKDQVDNYTVSEYNSMLMFLYLFVGIFSSIDCEIEPFTVFIESELTLGAGMGSSASGAICVAGAFLQYIRIKSMSVIKAKTSYKKCSLTIGNLEEFNEKYLDIISRWAFAAEKIMHGSPSGIDTTVCTFGSVVEFKKNSPFKRINLSSKINMFLIDTKISRNTKTLVKNVAILREKYQTTIDHILSAIDSISLAAIECFQQINDEKNGDVSCVVLDQYCRLQELVKLNQNLLSVLGVSHPAIDQICQIALNNKIEAKLTGAGGGGYTIILLSPEYSKECQKKLVNDLTQAGYSVISTTLGGAGVKIEKI